MGQNSETFYELRFYLEFYSSDSQPGAILLPRKHLEMFGDISNCHNWGG